MRHNTVQYSIVQCRAVQYSTAQHSTVPGSTVQYSTVQYRIVQSLSPGSCSAFHRGSWGVRTCCPGIPAAVGSGSGSVVADAGVACLRAVDGGRFM
jgi:hypothetical protein